MRKTLLLLALLSPAVLGAQAEGERSADVMNSSATLWAGSENSADMVFAPYREFNKLSLSYGGENGDWRQMQTGTTVGGLRFDTQGARQIGKMQLWGRFCYDNGSDSGSSFNTLLYDPYDERFLYNVADTVAGQWKRQRYDMQFKAAMPLGERLSAGVHVRYTDRIAAGQIDPRAESYHYSVDVKPGMAFRAGKSTFGLSGRYSNNFVRAVPSISNGQEIQKVYLMKGLGNWTGDQIGGNGLGTMYFRCNSWGGALQYSLQGNWTLLSEVAYTRHATRISESPTQPKLHGRSFQDELSLESTALFGNDRILNKLALDARLQQTRGIEPTVIWNTENGVWTVMNELEQCSLRTASADISYHRFLKSGEGHKAHWFGKLGLEDKYDSYATPASVFRYDNLLAEIGAERNFAVGKSGFLLLGASVIGCKNLAADYSYTGHREGTAPVRDLYPHNLAVLSADRVQASLDIEYSFAVAEGMKLAFNANGAGVVAFSTVGTLRRLTWTGAVKLYF